MIRFSCYCGHPFVLDDSEADGLVQCPKCRKLCDVPAHGDLQQLDELGGMQLKPLEIIEEPDRLAKLNQMFGKSRQDERGNDIDLRQTPADLAQRGGVASPRQPGQIIRPRYDPETGQLIRPMDVTPLGTASPALPERARPGQRRGGIVEAPANNAWALTQAGNIFAMLWVVLAMLLAGVMVMLSYIAVPTATGTSAHMYFWLGPGIILEFLVLAHYGFMIEDLGPQNGDEMPRFLGDGMWHENIWAPLKAVVLAVVLCYLPAGLAFNIPGAWPGVIAGAILTGVGTFLFPVILLTLATSGTVSNLRPDRVAGVIKAAGSSYLLCVGSWIVAGLVYWLAFLKFLAPIMGQFKPVIDWLPEDLTMLLMVPILHIVTVPFAHAFAWQTAMLYRGHHGEFPWVGQHFVKEPEAAK